MSATQTTPPTPDSPTSALRVILEAARERENADGWMNAAWVMVAAELGLRTAS